MIAFGLRIPTGPRRLAVERRLFSDCCVKGRVFPDAMSASVRIRLSVCRVGDSGQALEDGAVCSWSLEQAKPLLSAIRLQMVPMSRDNIPSFTAK
jgi:hypothetical protein